MTSTRQQVPDLGIICVRFKYVYECSTILAWVNGVTKQCLNFCCQYIVHRQLQIQQEITDVQPKIKVMVVSRNLF